MAEIEQAAARTFVLKKFRDGGDYTFLKEGELESMVDAMQALDEAFMASTGVEDGGVYDDEAAFESLFAGMKERFP